MSVLQKQEKFCGIECGFMTGMFVLLLMARATLFINKVVVFQPMVLICVLVCDSIEQDVHL